MSMKINESTKFVHEVALQLLIDILFEGSINRMLPTVPLYRSQFNTFLLKFT